jgi:hypothetical protein
VDSIGTTFNTSNGATVTRRETPYLPVAPRLLLASASRLQELHNANEPSGMVAG